MVLNLDKIGIAIKSILAPKKVTNLSTSSNVILDSNRSLAFKLNDPYINNLIDEVLKSRIYEERYRFALDDSAIGVWDWDIKTDIVFYSSESLRILEVESDDLFENWERWHKAVHPEDLQRYFSFIQSCFDGETITYEYSYRVLTSSGKYKWIIDRARVIKRDNDGKPLRLVGTHADISFQKKKQQELAKK